MSQSRLWLIVGARPNNNRGVDQFFDLKVDRPSRYDNVPLEASSRCRFFGNLVLGRIS
jgi:hypothetical protein